MPSFEIVELVDGKPRPFPCGVFPDGTTAASIIQSLSAQYPDKKFQPRPLKDETRDWKAREQRRFDEQVYVPLGIDLPPIKDHFAHKALKTPANVAFTPDASHGKVDKQVSIHINTYLQRFYPKLTVEQRRKAVWDYCGEELGNNVLFAKTADEIEWVYLHGPRSCMAYDVDYYGTTVHPVRAYAGPDLAIAYLKDGERVTARAVCWPDKKIFGGPYGDRDKLSESLKELGYKNYSSSSDFDGARLTYIHQENYYHSDHDEYYEGPLCPYLDIAGCVRIEGDYLVIDNYGGNFDCQRTCGVATD